MFLWWSMWIRKMLNWWMVYYNFAFVSFLFLWFLTLLFTYQFLFHFFFYQSPLHFFYFSFSSFFFYDSFILFLTIILQTNHSPPPCFNCIALFLWVNLCVCWERSTSMLRELCCKLSNLNFKIFNGSRNVLLVYDVKKE